MAGIGEGIKVRGLESDLSYDALVYYLLTLTRIPSPSGSEQEISKFCSDVLLKTGFSVVTDEYGNIMASRGYGCNNNGKYVLLNAHMDVAPLNFRSVERYTELGRLYAAEKVAINEEWDYELPKQLGEARLAKYRSDAERYATLREIRDDLNRKYYGMMRDLDVRYPENQRYTREIDASSWNPNAIFYSKSGKITRQKGHDVYIGGDDKAGVGIILTLAEMTDLSFKVLLTTREETVNDAGINIIPASFFDDVAFDITLDKSEGNLLTPMASGKKLCEEQLFDAISEIGRRNGLVFERNHGVFADVIKIREYVECVNMSNGSYNPHKDTDYIFVPETHRILTIVMDVIRTYNSFVPPTQN